MIYNKLGQTNMTVSKISLGGANFGDVYSTDFDVTKVEEIVSAALKFGINFIDTAYWYGQGKSEERLGQVLEKIDRSKYYIGTKVGRYEPELSEQFDFSADRVLQSVDASLARLRLRYVDLIQIHDADFAPNESIILNETLPALQKVKNEGKARYIGITGYNLKSLWSIIDKSTVPVDTIIVFARANLHDGALKDYIPMLKEKGVGIINASSLSMGLLTPQGPPSWHPASQSLRKATQEADLYCNAHGYKLPDLARRYGINFLGIDTTLVGVDNLSNLTDCLKALEAASEEELNFISELKEKFFPTNENWEKSNEDFRRKIYKKD